MNFFIYLFFISSLLCAGAKNVKNYRIPRDFIGFNEDDSNYLEQCRPLNFIMGQFGVVNVLAFLDESWPFSYKQATMLNLLNDRLQRSGFPDIFFFVITTRSNLKENIQENEDIEKEAWERISPNEVIKISSGLETFEPLGKIISPDIFVIEDSHELGLWEELKGARDQILVLDQCGRLAYQVIVPWSILHFPYVKAAILSTHEDAPCGPCESNPEVHKEYREFGKYSNKVPKFPPGNKETTMMPPLDKKTTILKSEEKIDEVILPKMKIIMHAPHYHVDDDDSAMKQEYLVLKIGEPIYHGHLDESGESTGIPNLDVHFPENIIFGKDESPGLYGEVADFWRDSAVDEDSGESEKNFEGSGYFGITENSRKDDTMESPHSLSTLEDYPESVTNFADVTVEEEETRSKLIEHYSRLLPWVYYVLRN